MSSPLSVLMKPSRAPLPGTHAGPGCTGAPDPASEAALVRKYFPQNQSGLKVTQRSRPKEGPAPSDMELMSSMMRKISQLEKNVKAQEQEIYQKNKRISLLEEKLKIKDQENLGGAEELEDQGTRTCQQLQKQLQEMERFLKDYGMSWVGGGEEDEEEDEEAGASAGRRFSLNFDLVLRNLEELNAIGGGPGVTFVPGGARLTQRPSVPLCLYRNGIQMFRGPFRSYEHPDTQRCLQDVMDGYFPSELRDRFPDGVTFQVHDRRDQEFRAEFPGRGHRLPGPTRSVEEFVRNLPQRTVRAGKVIAIRSALEAHLKGRDGAENLHEDVIETPALKALQERSEPGRGCEGGVTRLRVKAEDGERTFVLRLFLTETVGDLRRYLDNHRGQPDTPYDIISALPRPRRHRHDDQTLQESGLTPSATLMLRPRGGPVK